MFPLKRNIELLHCKQDLLLHGKVYISSQTVHSANLEPRFLLIVLLLILFPCSLIRFSKKKNHPARLFHPALLLIFRKIPTLLFDT